MLLLFRDNKIKGTPMRSGRVTHFKIKFLKICCFLLMCVEHSNLSTWARECRKPTLLCLLLAMNLKLISIDLGKVLVMVFPVQQIIPILNRVARSIEDILRYHKISSDTLHMLVTS